MWPVRHTACTCNRQKPGVRPAAWIRIKQEVRVRRTTQWAVFTSMNKQQPAWRSLYEPAERAASMDGAPDAASIVPVETHPESRSAPDVRCDRVDFM